MARSEKRKKDAMHTFIDVPLLFSVFDFGSLTLFPLHIRIRFGESAKKKIENNFSSHLACESIYSVFREDEIRCQEISLKLKFDWEQRVNRKWQLSHRCARHKRWAMHATRAPAHVPGYASPAHHTHYTQNILLVCCDLKTLVRLLLSFANHGRKKNRGREDGEKQIKSERKMCAEAWTCAAPRSQYPAIVNANGVGTWHDRRTDTYAHRTNTFTSHVWNFFSLVMQFYTHL